MKTPSHKLLTEFLMINQDIGIVTVKRTLLFYAKFYDNYNYRSLFNRFSYESSPCIIKSMFDMVWHNNFMSANERKVRFAVLTKDTIPKELRNLGPFESVYTDVGKIRLFSRF